MNETAPVLTPTPTIIFPNPKTVTIQELGEMDYETLTKYLERLSPEEINNLPEGAPEDEISPSSPSGGIE